MKYSAVIPAAGRGTRLQPMTNYLSKAMFPLGERPVLYFVVQELRQAGVDWITVVANEQDRLLIDWVEDQEGLRLAYQSDPCGLADALLQGWNDLGRPEALYYALPDNLVVEGNGTDGLLAGMENLPGTLLGTMEVTREDARYLGNSGGYESERVSSLPEDVRRITSRQSKGDGTFLRSETSFPTRRTVGRGVLSEEFFQQVQNQHPDPATGEVDDGPVFQELISFGSLYCRPLGGRILDVGEPDRFRRAVGYLHEQGFPSYDHNLG